MRPTDPDLPALSPCPFCGGPAKLVDCDERWIECMDCEASTGAYGTQDAAVAAWNRRSARVKGLEVDSSGQERLWLSANDAGERVEFSAYAGGAHHAGPWGEITLLFHAADGTVIPRTYDHAFDGERFRA